jgi:hypothetical protein
MDDRWNRVPDGIDPIVGYRAWYYTIGQRGARLHPLIQRGSGVPAGVSDWDGASWGWVTATCSRGAASWHVAPEENCTCGFYAMSTLPPVVSACGFRTAEIGPGDTSGVVLGRVELAGKSSSTSGAIERSELARGAHPVPRNRAVRGDPGRALGSPGQRAGRHALRRSNAASSEGISLSRPDEPSWDDAGILSVRFHRGRCHPAALAQDRGVVGLHVRGHARS